MRLIIKTRKSMRLLFLPCKRIMSKCSEEHSSGDCHHCLDGPLGDAIVMVSANTSKLNDLSESFKLSPIVLGCECSNILVR
jgi:hypothetical protein